MAERRSNSVYDTAIVGGGPAGLSAAIVLGRSCRRVVLFDHGRPRNRAAQAIHCFLGVDAIPPKELRRKGRDEAHSYGVELIDAEVIAACALPKAVSGLTGFEVQIRDRAFKSRTLLIATGMADELPDIVNFEQFYGRSVHHCPYCDGWEHRNKRLAAFGNGGDAAKLALELRTWSPRVTACANGLPLSTRDRARLEQFGLDYREERVVRLQGENGRLAHVLFVEGPPLACEALFFSTGQRQCSSLPAMLGCECDNNGLIRVDKSQRTLIEGLFLAGDADCEVQFAVMAAAEGAASAVAINKLLQEDDQTRTIREVPRRVLE